MRLLTYLFIKDYKNIKDAKVRTAYGKLASVYGIFWNILLFISKLIIGTLFHSVSIRADAFNNLSDAGSSIIALIGFVFSSKPADEDHPFGHERLEYIFSLGIAFIIMFFGLQLMMTSFDQILNPVIVEYHGAMIVVLIISIIIKLYMYFYNIKYAKLFDSSLMYGTAMDSFGDVAATSTVLIGMFISYYTNIQLDGYLGIIVAIFVMKSGYEIVSETINKLIGEAPDPKLTQAIVKKILSYDGVLGVHDLVVHTYGPKKTFVSVHVEVSSKVNILKSHDVIDNIEKDFASKENINVVIHMDPVDNDDTYTNEMRIAVAKAVKQIDACLSIHDFRIVRGETHNNFIFDVDVPIEFKMKDHELMELVKKCIPQGDIPNYAVITIDRAYITIVEK